ncbi:hypothetical protein BH11MYX1_BH11MYX1_32120 [soil metagenome]
MTARYPALLLFAGCFQYSEFPPERPDPVLHKLADARILSLAVNLHDQPGLCPGREGRLYVTGTVQWPGSRPVLRGLGRDVDAFDASTFSVTGPLIRADATGTLYPDGDVQKSLETGFAAKVVYTLAPTWEFHETWQPEYSCFTGSGLSGSPGSSGSSGSSGASGGQGANGTAGGEGGRGTQGGDGGRLTAYVTIVSTKFYPKLFAVIANNHFYLAPAERQLGFSSIGGPGGGGGEGGDGGAGGDQRTKSVQEDDKDGNKVTVIVGDGAAGNGGGGGAGGADGNGGNGGTVDVIYDQAFPELRNFVATEVSGGTGGNGGNGGTGGTGGRTTATRNAQQGSTGSSGSSAGGGRNGGAGRASVRAGAVTTVFRGIHGISFGERK